MKYVLLADVHGNYDALRAIVDTFPKGEVEVYSAGDTLGYGAEPHKCVEVLKELNALSVIGNHDAAVVERTLPSEFSGKALEAVKWTREILRDEDKDLFKDMPLTRKTGEFEISHGTLHEPEEYIYMLSDAAAMHTFEVMKKNICFVGHSHIPSVFMLDGGRLASARAPEVMELDPKVKYIINVGSVGQPRDGDPRASYCVYDTEKEEVEFRRVEYEIRSAQEKILEAGLPPALAERLSIGR